MNPGLTRERIRQARETGDRSRSEGLCRPLARAGRSFDQLTQGSASLHPGLYAFARLGGLVEWFCQPLERLASRVVLPDHLAERTASETGKYSVIILGYHARA